MEEFSEFSPIQDFYKNKSVFLTGATGFVGQVIIEKLLRCTDIAKLYILVRGKHGKDWKERVKSMFLNELFDALKKERPNFIDRIVGVSGDCTLPRLGLSLEDQKLLVQNVNIVLHSAASVKFDEKLSRALTINAIGTKNLVIFSKEIKNLQALVYISTAFSNCNQSEVKEIIYEPTKDMLKIMQSIGSEMIDKTEETLIENFPNSYVFSKHIAESVVKEYGKELPSVVFRPAIVMPTCGGPVKGWANNYYGPIGVIYGVAKGALRVFPIKKESRFELVPVDMVVDAILASAWDIFITKKDRGNEIPVYNFVTNKSNPITLGNFVKIQLTAADNIPLANSFWYCTFSMIQNKNLAKFLHYFYHIIPAFLVDIVLAASRQKIRVMPIYKKISKMMDCLPYFYYRQWAWHGKNVEDLWKRITPADKKWLVFDMSKLEWESYMKDSLVGMRYFIGKEKSDTIPKALAKQKKLKYIHYSLVYTIRAVLLYILVILVMRFYVKNFE